MTWIRFEGEREFINLFLACERQKLFRFGETYLILIQKHPFPCPNCQSFLSCLLEDMEKNSDIKAKLLIADNGIHAPISMQNGEVLYLPESLLSSEQLRSSLGSFSYETSVLIFDQYGSLWFAWSGGDLDIELVQDVIRWLTYLDIQCPE